MTTLPYKSALIVGTGPGIGSSLVRRLAGAGLKVAASARDTEKLKGLADETGADLFGADATDPRAVERLFKEVEERIGVPEIVVYNASGRVRGAIVDLDPEEVRRAIEVSAFGAFLVVRQAAARLAPLGAGAILLTGASASVKGVPQSSACAALPRARRASWRQKASTSRIS